MSSSAISDWRVSFLNVKTSFVHSVQLKMHEWRKTQIHISVLSNFHSTNWPSVAGTRSLKTAPAKKFTGFMELWTHSDWSAQITWPEYWPVIGQNSPTLASHVSPSSGGDSWGWGWWWPRLQPPWTWWHWNMWLEVNLKCQFRFSNDSWCLPMSGLFDVIGMMDETVLRNMVSDSKIVTPKKAKR